jgi:hypothetical protein
MRETTPRRGTPLSVLEGYTMRSTRLTATIHSVRRGTFKRGQRFVRVRYRSNGRLDHCWFVFHKLRQRGEISRPHMAELYQDLVDRQVPVQLELRGKILIGTWAINPNPEPDEFRPPPPRTYSCSTCHKAFTAKDDRIGIIGAVIETGTGCYRVAVHRRCEDGAMGLY